MKPYRLNICLALFLTLISSRLSAQVTYIGQFKVTVYQQSGPNPPTDPNYPNAYYFGVTLNSDPIYAISLPMVFTPSTTTSGEFIMNENGPQDFGFGSPNYADKTDFDSDYPNGTYDYFIEWPCANDTLMSEDVYVDVPPEDLYVSTIPALSPDSWQALQNLDPSQDVILSWAPYTQQPDADLAHTFIGTYDNQTFNSFYGGFNFDCDTDQTSVVMPAGSLEYGRSYTMNLYYSDRLQPNDITNQNNNGVFVIIGFDNLTQITINTIQPPLTLGVTNQVATLTWPSAAFNFELQTTGDLAGGNWQTVTEAREISGSLFVVNLPATDSSAFYKLAPVSLLTDVK